MIEKIREIASLGVWGGYKNDPDIIKSNAVEFIYIARNEEGMLGIVTASEKVFLAFEYDSITPLTFGVWLVSQKDRYGAICLSFSPGINRFRIDHQIPCRYNYISAEHGNILKLSRYQSLGESDRDDLFFPEIGLMLPNARYDDISWTTYFIEQRTESGCERFLLNAKDGRRFEIGENWFVLANRVTPTGTNYLLFLRDKCDDGKEETMLVSVSEDFEIHKSAVYDDYPIAIYAPDTDGMTEAEPVAFIGLRNDKYYLVNPKFKEERIKKKSFGIFTEIAGTKITGVPKDRETVFSIVKDKDWTYVANRKQIKWY